MIEIKMRKIILVLFTPFIIFSCGDDPIEEIKESWFTPYESEWLITESDYFGISKGSGTYYYFFEEGVVSHYVDNGKLKGIIFTWNYELTELDGLNFIELKPSICWNSDQGGVFVVNPLPNGDGFRLLDIETVSNREFIFATPNFDLVFEDNSCAEISSDWIDNYDDAVMASIYDERFNKVVFKEGIAYSKPLKLTGFIKAFTYQGRAENDIEYLEILEVCPDYQADFGIISGLYDANEFNNDGNGNNGFEISQGSISFVFLEVLSDFPDELDEDCYTTVF